MTDNNEISTGLSSNLRATDSDFDWGQKFQARAAQKQRERRWPHPIGFVTRIIAYFCLLAALCYSFDPSNILNTPLAQVTLGGIVGTLFFFTVIIFLMRALFRPSKRDEVRDAWGALGLLIIIGALAGALYLVKVTYNIPGRWETVSIESPASWGAAPVVPARPQLRDAISDQALSALVAQIDREIAKTNQEAPITLDALTKIKSASRLGTSIAYNYEVALPLGQWTETLRKSVTRLAIKTNCLDDKDTRTLLNAGYSVKHSFLDQSGHLVLDLLVTKDTC